MLMGNVIEAVTLAYSSAWKKWPDTQDKCFDDILRIRQESTYRTRSGKDVTVRMRWFPVHLPFVSAGEMTLPTTHPYINNLREPSPKVRGEFVRQILALAKDGCEICFWQNAWNCYPSVAQAVLPAFKHRVVMNGDDAPGSTEIRTSPVAKHFNAVFHMNLIWNHNGERTADLYRRLGVSHTYYVSIGGTTSGLFASYDELMGFDLDKRIDSIRNGQYDYDLVFVGGLMGPTRADMNRVECAAMFKHAGMRTLFHGIGMRDGILQPMSPIDMARPVSSLYLRSFAVLNAPFVGLMGTRPFDVWAIGSLLLQHDAHGELAQIGVLPSVHYVEHNGTYADMIDKVRYYRAHVDETEKILREGHAIGRSLPGMFSHQKAMERLLSDLGYGV